MMLQTLKSGLIDEMVRLMADRMSKLKKLLLYCAILFVLILASLVVQFWSNQIIPHDGSHFYLAFRGMMEFGLIMGIITAVALLIEDYRTNNGNEYFSSPARIILNLLAVPFFSSLLVLFPSFLMFAFVFVPLGEFFLLPFLFGPYWELKEVPELYLCGGVITFWAPLYFCILWFRDKPPFRKPNRA